MEGFLTPEQKEALKDEGVRIALRYVIEEQAWQPWHHAHYSKTMTDLVPKLGSAERVNECVSKVCSAGFVKLQSGEHRETVRIAGGYGETSHNIITDLLTLRDDVPYDTWVGVAHALYG